MIPEIDPTWFLFRCPQCRRWFSAQHLFPEQPVRCSHCGNRCDETRDEDENDDLQWKM